MGIVRGLAHSRSTGGDGCGDVRPDILRANGLDGFTGCVPSVKQARSIYAPGLYTLPLARGQHYTREGDDITLIANGIMVAEALEAGAPTGAAGRCERRGRDMFTLKSLSIACWWPTRKNAAYRHV